MPISRKREIGGGRGGRRPSFETPRFARLLRMRKAQVKSDDLRRMEQP
jgi:hypothetical protein